MQFFPGPEHLQLNDMIDLTVANPKQWTELMSMCPTVGIELPSVAHHSHVNLQHDVSICKTHLQTNIVNTTVSIEKSISKPFYEKDYLPPTDDILGALHKCTEEKDLAYARHIHVYICHMGLDTQTMLECHFVSVFVECASIHDAQHVFNRLVVRDECSWRFLIQGYIANGESDHAFMLFERMQADCMHASKYVFIILLKACASIMSKSKARKFHSEIAKEGYEADVFVASSLVDTYMKVGALVDARFVFDDLQVPDVVLWTTLMGGYADRGFFKEALDCYEKMQLDGVPADRVAYICSLKCCSCLGLIGRGATIHIEIVKRGIGFDISISDALVGMYAKCGWLSEAREIFQEISSRCVTSWNALIAGYSDHGHGEEALRCLEDMRADNISADDVTFVWSLKACASAGAVQICEEIHTQIVKQGFESVNFVGSVLVDAYCKCSLLKEAHKVFEGLVDKDVVSWTSLIAGYAEFELCEESLLCMEQMQMDGTSPDAFTFDCILNVCASTRAVERGLCIHAEIVKRGMELSSPISGSLIKLYAKVGLFTEVIALFDKVPVKDDISMNGLIGGLVDYQFGGDALYYMDLMQTSGVCMDESTLMNGLKACGSLYTVEKGFEMHSQITKFGLDADSLLSNNLVDMYSKCGFLSEAQAVFDRMQVHTTVSWTALLAGYAEHGHGKGVLDLLELMQVSGVSKDVVAFICSLKACCCIGALNKGQDLHSDIVIEGLEKDPFAGSALVAMYAKCACMSEAEEVLNELPVRNMVSWTAVIAAYVEQACAEDALRCFVQMQSENVAANAVTYACVLKACKISKLLDKGRQIHSEIIKVGIDVGSFVCSNLVDLYATCSSLTEAKEVFDKLVTRDILSWNALIGGYCEWGQDEQVLDCLEKMQIEGVSPDEATYICSLRACYPMIAMTAGLHIHSEAVKKGFELNPFLSSCVVDMYIKHQAYPEAQKLFEQLPVRDTVSWSALIIGYFEQGLTHKALRCFKQMQVEGSFPDVIAWNVVLRGCAEHGDSEIALVMHAQMLEQGVLPDTITFLSTIKACGNTSSLDLGKKFLAQCWQDGVFKETEMILATALVEMFGNCGSLASAQQVFDAMPQKDTAAWNALMQGYSRQGENKHALHLFESMIKEGVHPDSITFLCVLMACNHVGSLDKGQEYFENMSKVYGISPSIEHHNCMIDLLGRAGHLDDALIFLKQMPFKPNVSIVNTLLCACRKWGNIDVGKQVFEYAMRLKEKDGGVFVSMSNIYVDGIHTRDHLRNVDTVQPIGQGLKMPQTSFTEFDRVMQVLLPENLAVLQVQGLSEELKHFPSKVGKAIPARDAAN